MVATVWKLLLNVNVLASTSAQTAQHDSHRTVINITPRVKEYK